jgi:hypothetical protein
MDCCTEGENAAQVKQAIATTMPVDTMKIFSINFWVGHFSALGMVLHFPQQHPQKLQQQRNMHDKSMRAKTADMDATYGIIERRYDFIDASSPVCRY